MLLWLAAWWQGIRARVHMRPVAGQGLVEYAMIILFVALVVIAVVAAIGQTLCTGWYSQIVNNAAWGGSGTAACP